MGYPTYLDRIDPDEFYPVANADVTDCSGGEEPGGLTAWDAV